MAGSRIKFEQPEPLSAAGLSGPPAYFFCCRAFSGQSKKNKGGSPRLPDGRGSNSNNNSNTKIDKENWKIILGRKGPIEYAHKLANEQIQSKKPVSFKVINEILA